MNSLTYILLMTSVWYENKRRLSVNISCSIKKYIEFQEHWRFKKQIQTGKTNSNHQTKWSKVKAAKKNFCFHIQYLPGLRGWVVAMELDTHLKSREIEGKPPQPISWTNIHTHPITQREGKVEVWLSFEHWQKIPLVCQCS